MAIHHVALATRDLAATHRFYTELMGFELVKTVIGPTEHEGGWARHVFYDTGGGGKGDGKGDGMIAFWDLHDEELGPIRSAISADLGLPQWVNHLAFDCSPDQLDGHRDRWLDGGVDVVEIDHEFCRSIYTDDPNGILVEWCANTRELTADDRADALAKVLATDPPPFDPPPDIRFHVAADRVAAAPTPG